MQTVRVKLMERKKSDKWTWFHVQEKRGDFFFGVRRARIGIMY